MKRYFGNLTTIFLAGTLFLGMGTAASAQQAPPASQQPMEIPEQQPGNPQQLGPNDAGAGRVSFLHGEVSTQHSNSTEWAAATLNTPVVNGDHVATGKDASAEIQLDHASVLRMSGETTATIANLSRNQLQLQIGMGLANLDILKGNGASDEIDTPNVTIRPQSGEGSYRIQVNSDGETIVDVRKGSAEISTPQGSTRVERDQRITIEGVADNAQYQVSGAPGRDEWDKWNGDRDRSIEGAQSWQHTNPNYTGSQDLDTYGHWNNVPDYGDVWFPSANADWAPYRDGRWVFEPYYGWTWVSYEPWGWAPYHYGRWFVYGGNWGWWPGPVYGGYDPVWAPAYVSFLGFGGGGWGVGFGIGLGVGNVGWLPCGPGDRFYPWYGREINRVNEVNIYNIHNDRQGFEPLRGGRDSFSNTDLALHNDHVRAGISSMRGDQFGRGPVPSQQQKFEPGALRQANIMTGSHPITPSHESFQSTNRPVNQAALPNHGNTNQHFLTANSPQSMARQPGNQQGGFNRGNSSAVPQGPQSMARPGFQTFGSNNNSNRGPVAAQNAGPSQVNSQNQQRGFTPPTAQPQQSSRPAFRTFTPPPSQSQSNSYNRASQGPSDMQSRSYPSQRMPSQQQYQPRGYPGNNSGYSRPTLNMQQPVVRPRGGYSSYPAPSMRSAPSAPVYRAAPSGGGSRGGNSGGGSRGPAPSSGGGHASSGERKR